MKKCFKKIFAVVLVIAVVLGSVPLNGFKGVGSSLWKGLCSIAVSAKEGVEEIVETITPVNVSDNKLASSGQCGDNVYWTFDKETGALTISGEGEMYEYANFEQSYSPFYYNNDIVEINIENGITNITYGIFCGCHRLKRITISDSVTSIGSWAFSGCWNLDSVIIPNSVLSIGMCAFSNCHLNKITIPFVGNRIDTTSNTQLGIIFGECGNDSVPLSLTTVVFSGERIPRYAFANCKSINNFYFSDNISYIGKNALNNTGAFNNKSNWENGVLYIDNCIIEAKKTIESVEIKSNTKLIAEEAFSGCNNLNFVIAEDIASWCNIDFADEYSNPMYYAKIFRTPEEIVYDLVIPDGVEQIKNYAFYGCQFLKSVIVPDSVKNIGSSAFEKCTRLLSVTFGDGLESIGDRAFCGCNSLKELSFGTGLLSVGSYAFSNGYYYGNYGSSSLNKVNVKDITSWLKIDFKGGSSNPLHIAENLYVNGKLAEEITVDGVDTVKKNTFLNCKSIKSVTIGDMVKEIDDNAFSCCSNLKTLKIGSNVERIGSYAFLNCDITGSLNIPGNVKTVGYQTFNKNSHLTSINISDGVETIGENAFANCSSLVNVSVPASVTTMGYGAFYKSSQITDVYYAKTKSEWEWLGGTEYFGLDYYKVNVHFDSTCAINGHVVGDEWVVIVPATKYSDGLVAKNCTVCGCILESKIVSYNDGGDYTSGVCGNKVFWSFDDETGTLTISGTGDMYNYSRRNLGPFYSKDSIKSVVIESGVTTIGNGAFSYCSNLTSVEIPDSVTRIGSYAFYDCNISDELVIPSSVKTVGYQSFEKNRNLEKLIISEGVELIGENAFALCENLKTVTVPSSINTLNYGTFYGCGSITDVYYSSSIYEWENLGGTEYFGLDMNKVSIHFAQKIASGRCGENVYWELDCETGSLTISGTGDMYDDNFNWSSPFRNKKYIKTLTIQPNVTRIGDFAFTGCTFLTSITISDSVTSIGGSAFYDCNNITSITIPSSVKTIESGAFEGCDIIKDVYFGGSCSDWGNISIGGRNISLRSANIHYASHSYVPFTTNPTCTQKGYTTYTCSVCGDSYVDDYTGALGHMPGEWVVTVVPTEQFEGIKTMYCPVCGEFIHSEVIPKTTSPAFVSSVSVSDVVIEYKSFSELTPQITADEGAEYTVTYTSSDSSIVSVDQNGRVYGEKKGSANITVTVTDSNGNAVTDTCKVSVEYSWWQWIIMTVLFGWLWY